MQAPPPPPPPPTPISRRMLRAGHIITRYIQVIIVNCFNDISVNENLISVRLKSKRQRINTINIYLCDISTPLVGVVFKHRD